MNARTAALLILAGIALLSPAAGTAPALEKETSLVTGKKIGRLAVAGRLLVDIHAEFMVSRTFEKQTVLNWYNCGLSGGGRYTEAGGNFGDFGLHVPHGQRDARYPRAVTRGEVPAVRFDGDDIMQGNFAVEKTAAGTEDMALEVWLRDEHPAAGETPLGWQSPDGAATSAPLSYPKGFAGSDRLRHIVVNCTADRETWYLDGKKVETRPRTMVIAAGHRMVLGGASAAKPGFAGDLVTVRLHTEAMTGEEIARNHAGGAMLGTELHDWWRTEGPEKWRADESEHFRNCVPVDEMKKWPEKRRRQFEKRLPEMFALAERLYHLYAERLAMRIGVVSAKREYRGDGVKYTIPNQPSKGSWMGWSKKLGFGWACQGAGHINPHELVHGCQAQTGGTMQGNYWEAHANFPQTYAGIYQTVPPNCVSRVCMFFPANGRCYYHARLMFEHLAQTPEYGPMFIAKLWYDGGTAETKNEYPWTAFPRFDPDPATPLAGEWTRMVQKQVTWDYEIFGGKPDDLYRADAARHRAEMIRYGRVTLEEIPYRPGWHRPPKEMTPQQLGYNICPLTASAERVSALLEGYVSTKRGGDWRAAFVGVTTGGEPVYGDVGRPGEKIAFDAARAEKLYLVVCAIPTKILPIKMTGDFRSFEQEKFPYRVKLGGCAPLDLLAPEKPRVKGAAHPNGGGFVAASAQVDNTAYVGPEARVLGKAKVLGTARVEDCAVVDGATVRDRAIVAGHALVTRGAVVRDVARVRDWGRVMHGAVIKDHAQVLEHGTQERKPCGGRAVIKGVAWSSGPVGGTAMIDGSYRKSNEVEKGRWFTWSWGKGKNPGEDEKEHGGLYLRMTFDRPHEWMARDDFGATWGYRGGGATTVAAPTGDPRSSRGEQRVPNSMLALDGRAGFVELPRDVARMRDLSIRVTVIPRTTGDGRILEFSARDGGAVSLGITGGKVVFSMTKDGRTQSLDGPALRKGTPATLLVVLAGDTGTLLVDGTRAARNEAMTLNPEDIGADACFIGRGRDGGFLAAYIDDLEIHRVPLRGAVSTPSRND